MSEEEFFGALKSRLYGFWRRSRSYFALVGRALSFLLWNLESGIWNLESGIWNLEFEI